MEIRSSIAVDITTIFEIRVKLRGRHCLRDARHGGEWIERNFSVCTVCRDLEAVSVHCKLQMCIKNAVMITVLVGSSQS